MGVVRGNVGIDPRTHVGGNFAFAGKSALTSCGAVWRDTRLQVSISTWGLIGCGF